MKIRCILVVIAVLLISVDSQGGFMQRIDGWYQSIRHGIVQGLRSTGSANKRGISDSRKTNSRSINAASRSNSNSLRETSQYFNNKFQEPMLGKDFPCPTGPGTPGARSATRPTSVHELRPGDIDIVGAMGDSLTSGSGSAAANLMEVYVENRGMSWSGGGESTWHEYLTISNILKEFNPKIIGYSLQDSLSWQKDSQFNVAEPFGMSSDMPYQAQLLVKRMRSDSRVDIQNDWKLVTMMIGCNDFCANMCYYDNYSEMMIKHKKDVIKTLDYLMENLPRTLINYVPPPHLRIIQEFKGKPFQCVLTHEMECPCLFGLRQEHLKEKFTQLMREFQELDMELAEMDRYTSKDDFAVVMQPFLTEAKIPSKNDLNGNTITDFSYLSEDCFHFSQKSQALAANGLWNNMMESVGNKTTHVDDVPFFRFLCPSVEHPYIYTANNSFT